MLHLYAQAPELFLVNGQAISEGTDVWAYGCVLVELFANAIPWQSLDDVAIGKRVTSRDEKQYVPPEVDRILSLPIRQLVRRCLTRDANARPSFDDILAELDRIGAAVMAKKK